MNPTTPDAKTTAGDFSGDINVEADKARLIDYLWARVEAGQLEVGAKLGLLLPPTWYAVVDGDLQLGVAAFASWEGRKSQTRKGADGA